MRLPVIPTTIYICVSIFFFVLGSVQTEIGQPNELQMMHLEDVLVIIINNTIYIVIWFVFSLFAISPFLFMRAIYLMGAGANEAGINPTVYYSSSFLHGFGEWFCTLLVFIFMLQHLKSMYLYATKRMQFSELLEVYVFTLKKTIPFSILVIVVSAFVEVYVSNRLLLYFIQ